MANSYANYRREIIERFWMYRAEAFACGDDLFDRTDRSVDRPPVFKKPTASHNVLADPELLSRIIPLVPIERRHRWFGSMASSQALAQSVFGALSVFGKANLLERLTTDEGDQPFRSAGKARDSISLEIEVSHLSEPRPTSIDVLFSGANRVGIECKFAEQKIGACSRPSLASADPQFCDGRYQIQQQRTSRCSLTEIGVAYWRHVPQLFRIDPNIDHSTCPLRYTYQIIRNLLGICVLPDGSVSNKNRVVLVYDDRNPSFQEHGVGKRAYEDARNLLLEPVLLQKTSWQGIADLLRGDEELRWLTDSLKRKYGL